MNMEQQIERQRVLYYQSLELSRLLSYLAYEYHLKDERYERVERLNRKAEARMDRRFDRLMELHEAYMAYLQKQIDSSMKSTGLALSPAQPVEAVGQGASYECSVCLDTGYVWDNDEYTNVPCRDCGAWFEIGVPQ
ncbi:hypothetical protein [Methylobacter sp. sgz302048]|uniref:hypothetical protein n=1 Tax=Methylobacter sp. sgz302048 TaxID=3455945 RepID=UPI003F9F63B0